MKAERRNITQPADWWAAFEKQATADGMTLSEWVGECCYGYLPNPESLSERTRPGKPANSASSALSPKPARATKR